MGLDIRLPIGLFFSALGLLLTSFGIFGSDAISSSPAAPHIRSSGINIDVIWGVVLLFFGLAMIILARRARKARPDRSQSRDR
ncbi:MAG TPA: hypothetical protein VF011_13935 [Terriglobales bacterium]